MVLAALAFFLFVPGPSAALDPERSIFQYKHSRWTAAEGAPPVIYSLAQGADGYIWIGSAAGLYRFDGVTFEHIRSEDRDADALRIISLLAANDGSIWVGYHNGAIGIYRNGKLRVDRTAPLTDSYVLGLEQTTAGDIWAFVSRAENSILRFHEGKWETLQVNQWGLPPEPVDIWHFAGDGTTWLVVGTRVYTLSPGEKRFRHTASIPLPAQASPENIGAISEDSTGAIWFSDPFGTRPLRGSSTAAFPTPSYNGWPAIARFDRDGNIWGISRNGLYRVRAPRLAVSASAAEKSRRVERFTSADGLTANTASGFLEDREGNIWIGSSLGLDQFRNANIVVEPSLTGFLNRGFALLAASDGSVYAGTDKGVFRVAPQGDPEPILDVSAYLLCESPDKAIWVFTHENGYRIERGQSAAISMPQFPTISSGQATFATCAGNKRGKLWISGGEAGLFEIKGAHLVRTVGSTKSDWVESVAQSRDGEVLGWLKSGAVVELGDDGRPARTSMSPVRPVLPFQGNFLYDGRRYRYLIDTLGISRISGDKIQLADPGTYRWAADPRGFVETPAGQAWFIGREGIVGISASALDRVFRGEAAEPAPLILGFDDGLPNVRSTTGGNGAVRGGDGRLWFKTIGGLVWIHPDRLFRNRVPPIVQVRGLTTRTLRIRDPKRVELRSGTSSLSIQYTALSFTIPGRVKFRYRLEGVDESWVDAGARREAFYSNLGPGTYRFQVIAANNDGIWNREGAALDFVIPPTFIQSIWFKLLIGLVLVAFLAAAYFFRLRQVTSRLQARFDIRIAERERIARELHDTLLQGFQGLMLQIKAAANRLPDPAMRQPLDEALDRGKAVLIEGRDRVRELRSLPAENDLGEALLVSASGLLGADGPAVELTCEGPPQELHPLVRDEIERVGEEALRNIVSHAHARTVAILVVWGSREFKMSISDDGEGMPPEIVTRGERPGHFGLLGMRERAERIGGRLAVSSRVGRGTEVALILPARAAYREHRPRVTERLAALLGALRGRYGS